MSEKNKKNADSLEVFRSAPVWQAVLKNAVPAMLAMLMALIYNLADTFFIGQTGDAYQVAAVSLAMPVFLFFMAFGTIFGIGGTSVISRAMGEGRKDYAKNVCSFCMWGCVAVGAAMAVLLIGFMNPLLNLIGASEGTEGFARSYLTIVSLAGPFVLISNCYSNVVRAEGRSTDAMMGQLIGNLLNVILDPIMILWLGWGIVGAAVATAIGNIVGACYYLLYFLRGNTILSIHPRDFTVRNGVCTGVLAIGIPAALGSIMMSISNIVVNAQMAKYGDMALAGIGVAMKVIMLTGMMCIGFAHGVQPLLGYCVGAKNWDRYRKSLRMSIVFAFCLSLFMTILCLLFTDQFVGAFLSDPEAVAYGVQFARILLSTGFLFGVYYVLSNALQAMGAATAALITSLSRQGLIYIPALFILQALLGINGLVWAQPVADVLSLILVIALYFISMRRLTGGKNAAEHGGT